MVLGKSHFHTCPKNDTSRIKHSIIFFNKMQDFKGVILKKETEGSGTFLCHSDLSYIGVLTYLQILVED